ncbi:MAG: RsmE family RNA methyltransferase [Candidatus Yanofskybacteria bacterium]|nr:RsmE family RNA methyltransferase [Candidatus Yanofskybacteria bacterium]
MRLNRFIIEAPLRSGRMVISNESLARQLKSVLKLKTGEKIIISDGGGNESTATIISFGKDSVEIELENILKNRKEPKRKVSLYCSVLKAGNFEFAVQKATEIGVYEIIPVISSRTIKTNIRPDRLKKIIREAAEQSGRAVIPNLVESLSLEESFARARGSGVVFCDFSGNSLNLGMMGPNEGSRGVFIGPEGGWSEDEVNQARKQNFEIVSLGPLTLRAETAAVVAVYLYTHEHGLTN